MGSKLLKIHLCNKKIKPIDCNFAKVKLLRQRFFTSFRTTKPKSALLRQRCFDALRVTEKISE